MREVNGYEHCTEREDYPGEATDSRRQQQNSYQVQIDYYTEYINSTPEWTLAGIFADEGISGTQTKKRKEFNRMIRMCKQKQIDAFTTD